MNRSELIATIKATKEVLKRRAREHFRTYVLHQNPAYDMQWFHAFLCDRLQAFQEGRIKKLMVFMPPQHGKTELTTRNFPPYLIGKDPNRKIAIVTYAGHIAQRFNRAIQRNIDNQSYGELFPETRLNFSPIFHTNFGTYVRNTDLLEIVNKRGSIKTIGRGGALTSEPVDIGIIDDPLKDRNEASSEVIRSSLFEWYTDVFLTRLHNQSQQLLIQTRWHEKDLAGRILEEEKDWTVVSFPAIKTEDESEWDRRQPGEALWEAKHSKEKIEKIKRLNEGTFNSLYQQDPKPPSELLVYNNWHEILVFPVFQTHTWGLDFGKTTGINALVKCAMMGEKEAFVQECLYSKGVPVSVIVDALFKNGYVKGEIVWCDHIPTKIQELRMMGIAAFQAVKGAGSVRAGIDKLKEYVIRYIGKNIKYELGKYQWIVYDDLITNEPVDDFNHLMDAARYGLLSRFFMGR